MKMLNSLMMDQKNTGVCGAGYSWFAPCDCGDADGARRHVAGCSMPLAEWQPKHLASGTCGSVKKYNNLEHVSRLVRISVPLMAPMIDSVISTWFGSPMGCSTCIINQILLQDWLRPNRRPQDGLVAGWHHLLPNLWIHGRCGWDRAVSWHSQMLGFCGVFDIYQCSHASLMWRIWHTHTQPNFLKGIDEHTSMHECRTTKDFSTSPATSLWPIDQSRKERRH